MLNSLRSATLTVNIRPFYSSFRDDTKEAVRFVLSFVLPACTSFCTNYFISYSLVLFSLAHISCTISCTYITAIHFIMSLCSLQSPKSHSILLYFVQTSQCAGPLSEPQMSHCRSPLSKILLIALINKFFVPCGQISVSGVFLVAEFKYVPTISLSHTTFAPG